MLYLLSNATNNLKVLNPFDKTMTTHVRFYI